jgi:hypothetical protein
MAKRKAASKTKAKPIQGKPSAAESVATYSYP